MAASCELPTHVLSHPSLSFLLKSGGACGEDLTIAIAAVCTCLVTTGAMNIERFAAEIDLNRNRAECVLKNVDGMTDAAENTEIELTRLRTAGLSREAPTTYPESSILQSDSNLESEVFDRVSRQVCGTGVVEDVRFSCEVQVFVKGLNGRSVSVHAYLGDDVVSILKALPTVCPKYARFTFQGKQLEVGVPLRQYGIRKESNIHLTYVLLSEMACDTKLAIWVDISRSFPKGMSKGEAYDRFEVKAGDTLGDVKARIESRCGVPTRYQRVLFYDQELKDNAGTMYEYNVRPGNVLFVLPTSLCSDGVWVERADESSADESSADDCSARPLYAQLEEDRADASVQLEQSSSKPEEADHQDAKIAKPKKQTARKQSKKAAAHTGRQVAERLRRKLDARKQCDDAGSSSNAKQGAQEEKPVDAEVPNDACAVCLCTEEESGRPVHWIFEACGHKCLCRPCLRKLKQKSSNKKGGIECPLCRVVSKPVLAERFYGTIFGTGPHG